MTKPKAITGYSKLVEAAAEKYADRLNPLAHQQNEKFFDVDKFILTMQSPEAVELIEQIAREAVAHASYERNFMSKDYGIVFSEGYWAKFMGVQGE